MSAYERHKLHELGFEDQDVLNGEPDSVLVGLDYESVKKDTPLIGYFWTFERDPAEYREAHAFLEGKKTDGVRNTLRKLAQWVIPSAPSL